MLMASRRPFARLCNDWRSRKLEDRPVRRTGGLGDGTGRSIRFDNRQRTPPAGLRQNSSFTAENDNGVLLISLRIGHQMTVR